MGWSGEVPTKFNVCIDGDQKFNFTPIGKRKSICKLFCTVTLQQMTPKTVGAF